MADAGSQATSLATTTYAVPVAIVVGFILVMAAIGILISLSKKVPHSVGK